MKPKELQMEPRERRAIWMEILKQHPEVLIDKIDYEDYLALIIVNNCEQDPEYRILDLNEKQYVILNLEHTKDKVKELVARPQKDWWYWLD